MENLSVNVYNQPQVRYTAFISILWGSSDASPAYPSNPHLGNLFLVTHSDRYDLFQVGQMASKGISQTSMFGTTTQLEDETLGFREILFKDSLKGVDVPVNITFPGIPLDKDHSLFSFSAMTAPSPDWFTGVSSIDLLDENGDWVHDVILPLWVFDAGTDYGRGFYNEPDFPRIPPRPIRFVTGDALFPNYQAPEPIGSIHLILQ